MTKIRTFKTPKYMEDELETVARRCVDTWIESGWSTDEMHKWRKLTAEMFDNFLRRDIRTFSETGKYPDYV